MNTLLKQNSKCVIIIGIFFLFLFLSSAVFAQDTLFKKRGDIIPCIVTEIGVDEIKYKDFTNLDGPVYVIRKVDVIKIVYKNGKTEYIKPDEMSMNKEEEIIDKNQCVKLAFLSPLFNHLEVAYERKLKMTKNLEVKFGFIGIGNETTIEYKDRQGAYFAGGIKFLLGQSYYINGMRYLHPLKGSYIKPEISLSIFDFSDPYYYYPSSSIYYYKYRTSLLAFNLIYGKQYILGNILTVDFHFGIGVGGESINKKDHQNTFSYYDNPYVSNFGNCVIVSSEFPLTLTAGILIGGIFK